MSEIKSGSPAFPQARVTVLVEDSDSIESAAVMHEGMTLRQYFAAHAPITLAEAGEKYAQNYGYGSFGDVLDYLADLRWAYADAMLAAREAKQ